MCVASITNLLYRETMYLANKITVKQETAEKLSHKFVEY